jgi:hypothetical protein
MAVLCRAVIRQVMDAQVPVACDSQTRTSFNAKVADEPSKPTIEPATRQPEAVPQRPGCCHLGTLAPVCVSLESQ